MDCFVASRECVHSHKTPRNHGLDDAARAVWISLAGDCADSGFAFQTR
jgi:hypothetical protein